jgi:ketosteroid isomerase-like protein
MSQENVEIAQRMIDAYNCGDVGAFADLATPDFEWLTSMGAIEGEVFRGREGIETYFANLSDAWEELRLYADEFRDLGDRVVWLGRIRGRGRSSHAHVDAPMGVVADMRGGKTVRIRSYLDQGEALRAAGLEE